MATSERAPAAARRPRSIRLLGAQVRYQLRVLWRSPIGLFATLVIPLMVLLAVDLLNSGSHLSSRGGIPYAQFFTPAMVAFAVINVCYMGVITSTTLARDEGILKRIRSTPLPPWVYMAGRLGAAALLSLLSAIVVIAVGDALYDFEIVWAAIPAVLVTLALGMFCFCALGLAVTVLVPRADAAFAVAWGTMLPLCFISDVFEPIDHEPGWLNAIAAIFPVRPFAENLETALNPVVGSTALSWAHLGVLAAWGVGATAFALVAFRWEPSPRRQRRRGPHPPAAFAVDRIRALLEEHRDAASVPRSTARHPALPPPPPARPAAGETELVERIEGPAPAEDSSVPPDPGYLDALQP